MEVEPRQYSVRLDDGESVLISETLIPYFGTLANMIADFGNDMPVIPLAVDGLTSKLMQAMVDFYTIYDKEAMEGIERSLVNEREEYADFYREWVFLLSDEVELANLATIADYLNARILLVFIHDRIYRELNSRSTRSLEVRYQAIQKRKSETSVPDRRMWRIQYRRAWLVNAILSSLLPYTLVRGIDTRIPQSVPLVIDSKYLSVIRYGEQNNSVFLRQTYIPDETPVLERTLVSLNKGYQSLYREQLGEAVLGDLFIGVLNTQAKLSSFGEFVRFRAPFSPFTSGTYQFSSMAIAAKEERTLDGKECVAVWSGGGDRFIIALTLDGLYVIGVLFDLEYKEEALSLPIAAADILDVSCGTDHALILTKEGVYGWGRNLRNQLSDTPEREFVQPTKLVIPGEVVKIVAAAQYSVVLLRDGRLYMRGKLFTGDRPSLFRVDNDIDGPWQELLLPVQNVVISVMHGNGKQFVIASGNRIWQLESITDGWHEQIIDGDVLEVTGHGNYILVRSTVGLFMFEATSIEVKQFGGTLDLDRVGQLPFTFDSRDTGSVITNKKPRLDCQYCFARAVFTDQRRDSSLCSRYCLYKSLFLISG